MNKQFDKYLSQIVLPEANSHKGQNGRILVIGGSRLFHAASFWAASMASKVVDMVHFSSPEMEDNELMRIKAKEKFWEGIVVPYEEVEHYIEEDDVILIGVGMERGAETRKIINYFLAKYPDKKWIVDGGALQECDTELLTKTMIVTPNEREMKILKQQSSVQSLLKQGVTILAKGHEDLVLDANDQEVVMGGNAGMTKGGTGDVLAGLVAALYARSPARAACMVASQINKLAGDNLDQRVGVFFAANDLIAEAQKVLGSYFSGDSRKDSLPAQAGRKD